MKRFDRRPLAFCLLIARLVAGASAQDLGSTLLTTFTNPSPEQIDFFSDSLTGVGSDFVLIGAPLDDTVGTNAGLAYLFGTEGTLLTTFTNPAPEPENEEGFGISVASVGSDRVLIGAPWNVGKAYLYYTNGALLTAFTNPSIPSDDGFGSIVAAVGKDRVLITAPYDGTGATNAGVAYLFGTNGMLLNIFTNPTPEPGDLFGTAVATMGSDRVLIGAFFDNTGAVDAGAAYLFSTNGSLLMTFTNPTPETDEGFGIALAAVGSDRVLIGAYLDRRYPETPGAAYLFGTNGALLTTFTKPTGLTGYGFGRSLAAVGNDRVLIGAEGAEAAFLFSTNGTLLTTFTNPTPNYYDLFGGSVAAIGDDRVLIGARADDTGATDAGSAYLFAIPYPRLNITMSGDTVSIRWFTDRLGWILQETDVLSPSPPWSDISAPVTISGLTNTVQLPAPMNGTNRFYRLRRP